LILTFLAKCSKISQNRFIHAHKPHLPPKSIALANCHPNASPVPAISWANTWRLPGDNDNFLSPIILTINHRLFISS
jgi:hypothetical protein